MQQSKIFYPHPETYAPRPLDRLDPQPNRPFPAFVLPENLASIGTPSLYHPGNQEKELFATPPAGFHMAPCGCFFDPRIYRIEWATANFLQPPVYKLSGGPTPQNPYLLDGQKYLKNPIQPGPYPAYPGIGSNPPFVLPFFKAEAPTAPGMDGFVGPPDPGPRFTDLVRFPREGLASSREHKLPGVAPESNRKEPSIEPTGAYEPLEGRQEFGKDLAFQAEEEGPSKECEAVQDLIRNVAMAVVRSKDPSPLGEPGADVTAEGEGSFNLEKAEPDGEPGESFTLPDEVLLEVAMKLFDCSPANSDTEVSLDSLTDGGRSRSSGEDSPKDGGFSGEDSPSDIRSLNLPNELLSFDYSVPEILSTVTSLDYLYDVSAFREETQWDSGPVSLPFAPKSLEPSTGSEEKLKKNKPAAGKPKPALAQGDIGEHQE
ncbi:proline-rich protein 22 [Pogona vitticeps]